MRCVENIDGSLAQNIDFELAASRGFARKTRISHEMLVLMLQHVSSQVSGFPLASLCLWGELQNLSVLKAKAGCNVFLRGRRDTSGHSHVPANASAVVLFDRRNTFERLLG